MFRPIFITSLITLATPLFADSFTAAAKVDRVTIYPGLSTVTRQVTLDLPAGLHDITVPGLPERLSTEGLRVAAPSGAEIGAVNLAFDRLPVTPDMTAPEIVAAEAEVERLEGILRERNTAIAEIRLRVAAAEEQIAFLKGLSRANAENLTAADISALVQMVGEEMLFARQAAFSAEQAALEAERDREDVVEELDAARRALAALIAPEKEGSVLTFTINAPEAGAYTVDVSTLEGFANWSPVYDMRLTTGEAASLDVERAVVISQETGQDWQDVELILSTARPGEQTAPGPVWPQLRRIISEEDLEREQGLAVMSDSLMSRSFAGTVTEEAVAMPAPVVAQADTSGATVTYRYPTRVTIRDGVEDLRLSLDTLTLEADVWAEAVPSRDTIAYRMAEFTNTTDELLLPGQALLFADGTMIGFSNLPLLAAGADTEMGFGPLDGLRATRTMPNRTEGDRGVFTTTNQLREEAIMTVENLTGQVWDVLLRDAIPYSEQEDLEVTFNANPNASRRNPDGQRGVLEWDLTLDAGEKAEVSLDYTLTWPNGFILR
ncbi:MAG: mucoidy inhibitor MuiA family protein [Pseudomonadota bacterium]